MQRTLIGCISKLTSGPVRFSITVSSKCLFIFVKSFCIMIYIIFKNCMDILGCCGRKYFVFLTGSSWRSGGQQGAIRSDAGGGALAAEGRL